MITEMLTPGMVKELDRMAIPDIEATYGPGRLVARYSETFGNWRPGDGTPSMVAEGPAEAQAMGRCVASRTRYASLFGVKGGAIHPTECGWCSYPMDILLKALDHAIFLSRHVETEYIVWDGKVRGETYARATGSAGEYRNPVWAEFWRGVTPSTANAPQSDLTYWSNRRRAAIDQAAERVPA